LVEKQRRGWRRNGRRETILVLCFVVRFAQRVSRERRGVEQREQPRANSAIAATTVLVSANTRSNRTELPAAVKKTKVHRRASARSSPRSKSLALARAAGVLSPVGARRARHHAQQKGLDVGFRRERERAAGRERHRRRAKRPLKDGVFFFVKIFSSKSKSSTAKKRNRGFAARPSAAPSATPNSDRRRDGEHRREQRVQNIALIVARLRYYACFRVF